MANSSGTTFLSRYAPALEHRNFRIFWLSQCVSMVGSWMQNVGQAWLVLELTGSAGKLAVVSAVQFLPMMLLSLFAGPFIDRLPKRRTLVFTQCALALLALALSALTATHLIRYWMLLVMAALLGLVTLLDNPTRQAFVIELADRDSLMNAVSLNSAAFNLARMLGPAAAGLLIDLVGIAPCYLLNSVSFLAVIAALLAIDVGNEPKGERLRSLRDVGKATAEGLAYIRSKPDIAYPLVLMAIVSTVAINYNIFVPSFAKLDLGRSASGFGFLMTCMGVGSLIAALALAFRSGKGPSRLRLYGGALGLCVALSLCGLQRSYVLSCVLLALVGYCTISFSASTNATIQLASDDSYRGRVMSVFSLVFGGVTPLGALYAGAVSEAAGPAFAMVLSGVIGFGAALLLLWIRRGRTSPAR